MKVCSIEGCGLKHVSRGYCRTHYYRFKRYGDPTVIKQVQSKNNTTGCLVEGCENKHDAKGYCKFHYRKFDRYGDPLYEKKTTCSIEGCGKKIEGKSFCQMHYARFKKYGDPHKVKKIVGGICKVEGCNEKNRNHGYCEEHYKTSDRFKEYMRSQSAKRRCILLNVEINDFTENDWLIVLKEFDGKCAYCGNDGKQSIDHVVPVTKGGNHTKNNIVPACRSCNSSKNNRELDEWYIKKDFYSKERENKIFKWVGYETQNKDFQMQLF